MVSVSRLFPQLRGLCFREEFINLSFGVSLVGDHLGCICGTLLIALDDGSPWEQAVCHLIPESSSEHRYHGQSTWCPIMRCTVWEFNGIWDKGTSTSERLPSDKCKGHYCWMTALMYNNFGVLVTEMRRVHGRWSNLDFFENSVPP